MRKRLAAYRSVLNLADCLNALANCNSVPRQAPVWEIVTVLETVPKLAVFRNTVAGCNSASGLNLICNLVLRLASWRKIVADSDCVLLGF